MADVRTVGETDTLKLAADRPYLACIVGLTIVFAARFILCAVGQIKSANRFKAAFSLLFHEGTLEWEVVVAGTFVVAEVLARAGVCTLTLVGASIVPLVSLVVVLTFVETLVQR